MSTLSNIALLTSALLTLALAAKKIPAGVYKSESSLEDAEFRNYMKVMGFTDDFMEPFKKDKHILILLSEINDTHWQINYNAPGAKTVRVRFEYGEQFRGPLLDGRMVNQTITVEEGFVERKIDMGGWESTQESVTMDDGGLQVILRAKEVESAMKFNFYDKAMVKAPTN